MGIFMCSSFLCLILFSLCVDCSSVEKLLICSTMLVSGGLCVEVNFLVVGISFCQIYEFWKMYVKFVKILL
jgi:hypothetical protein